MSVEEEKIDGINDEDIQYDRENNDLQITIRENDGTDVK